MKNKLMSSAAIGALLLGAAPAQAQDAAAVPQGGWYVSLFGGASFDENPEYSLPGFTYTVEPLTDTGYVLGVAVGYRIMPNLRGELEYSFAKSSYDRVSFRTAVNSATRPAPEGDVVTSIGLLNVWYDIDINSSVRPYIGGGIGFGQSDGDLGDLKDSGFAYQVGAGLLVPLSREMALDVSYRYRGITGLEDGFEWDAQSHNVQAGIIVPF